MVKYYRLLSAEDQKAITIFMEETKETA